MWTVVHRKTDAVPEMKEAPTGCRRLGRLAGGLFRGAREEPAARVGRRAGGRPRRGAGRRVLDLVATGAPTLTMLNSNNSISHICGWG
jgi:hypothetical protein